MALTSSTVTTGMTATAAQYNALRTDIENNQSPRERVIGFGTGLATGNDNYQPAVVWNRAGTADGLVMIDTANYVGATIHAQARALKSSGGHASTIAVYDQTGGSALETGFVIGTSTSVYDGPVRSDGWVVTDIGTANIVLAVKGVTGQTFSYYSAGIVIRK